MREREREREILFVHTVAVVDNRVLDNNVLRAIYVPILKIFSFYRKIIK